MESPYELVGHSSGGLYVRVFADRYADEVAGIVLVDSSHPEQFTRSTEGREYYERTRRAVAIAPWLAWLGVIRLFDLDPAPRGWSPKQRRSRRSAPRRIGPQTPSKNSTSSPKLAST